MTCAPTNEIINTAFMQLSKRAETVDRKTLVNTFVDVGTLFTLLSSRDHQVLYGRRGTGKTHALQYLAESREDEGDVVIYIDMRTLGSSGGMYEDANLPLEQRATRLLQDVLGDIHHGLLDAATRTGSDLNLGVLGPYLDKLADEVTNVLVVGETASRAVVHESQDISATHNASITAGTGMQAALGVAGSRAKRSEATVETAIAGTASHRVHFGAVAKLLTDISRNLDGKRIWILLDEWSVVPSQLQPYLADMIRRSVFPIHGVTAKIGAIEQRTQFRLQSKGGGYIGIELGADASADVNLDDYMVFDNDEERAKTFFREFLFKHFASVAGEELRGELPNSSRLVNDAFTQYVAFDEFVRATEGVPRDAINILSVAAQKALKDRISIVHVRTAARLWYQRDKESPVRSNTGAFDLLNWIIEEVIGHRKARAFLKNTAEHIKLVEDLFDARVLHVLKRNISSNERPGIRYDAYKIDFGCYVDLMTTNRAPDNLLPQDGNASTILVEVPPDDYRAIRRAILDFTHYRQEE